MQIYSSCVPGFMVPWKAEVLRVYKPNLEGANRKSLLFLPLVTEKNNWV